MNSGAKLTYASPDDPLLKTLLIQSIERLTGQRKLQNLYNQALAKPETSFWENALTQLQIKLNYDELQVTKIPLADHLYCQPPLWLDRWSGHLPSGGQATPGF